MTFFIPVLIFVVSASFGLLGTLLLERLAQDSALVQLPNRRSSHSTPTARGGGLAIVIVALAALLLNGIGGYCLAWPIAGVLGVTAVIGFLDDLYDLSPFVRFPAQAVVVAILISVLGPLPPIPFLSGLSIAGWLLTGLVLLCGLWWLNLFNFMDGIDGIAASQAIIVLIAGSALTWAGMATDLTPVIWLAWATIAATAGFLVRNWSPAHIFMGDVGSISLALVIFILALASIAGGFVSYPTWVILVSVLVSDTTTTLLRRIARGQKPWEGHRSHAYQQLSRQCGHKATTIGYALLTILWALPLSFLAQHWPAFGWLLMVVTYLPLLVFMLWNGAGSQMERQRNKSV